MIYVSYNVYYWPGVYNIIPTGVTAGGILDVDITTVAIDNLLVS